MSTRIPRTLVDKNEPNLARAGIIFGVVILASLGIGIAMSGDDDSAKQASTSSTTPSRVASTRTTPASAAKGVVAKSAGVRTSATKAVGTKASGSAEVATVTQSASSSASASKSGPIDTGSTIAANSREPVTYAQAEAAYLARDWDQAASLFVRYTAQKPSNPWGHYMSGLAHRQTGDVVTSEAAFLACLEIDPDHAKSLVNLARVYLDSDRAAEAVDSAQQAVAVDSANVDAHRVLARAFHSQGRSDAALEQYAAALAMDPNDAWSLNNRGLILIEAGRFEDAVEPLTMACAIDGSRATFQNNLGVALERTERFRAAEQAYAAALNLDSRYEKAAVSLARVEELGGTEDAPVLAATPFEGDVATVGAETDDLP